MGINESIINQQGSIFDVKRFSVNDGPGIRTTVFFKGCPLDCWWCHNPESRQLNPEQPKNFKATKRQPLLCNDSGIIGKQVSAWDVIEVVRRDLMFYEESGGGVTFSGGEPLLQPEFLDALLTLSKSAGMHTAIDTSGYTDFGLFEKNMDHTDLILYDLKIMDDLDHQKYTGVSNQLILENLQKLVQVKKDIRIRIPLIPDITDRTDNLMKIISFLKSLPQHLPVDLLPFNPLGLNKYSRMQVTQRLKFIEIQKQEKLDGIKLLFEKAGFSVNLS